MDPSYGHFTIEEKPDVTYNDVGGCTKQIEKMREVLMSAHSSVVFQIFFFPFGCSLQWSSGTGKIFLSRAVANRTDACFIRVIGSELVHKYVSEGARMVHELFQPSVDIKTVLAHMMNRFSNYTALSAEVSAKNQTSLQEDNTFWFLNNFFLQVLPEFFRVEVFAKLNSAIGKVMGTSRINTVVS
ncbi:26S proteasome regulatory subunit 7-like [Capsicum galapagoense]